jgi:hypothetical protein
MAIAGRPLLLFLTNNYLTQQSAESLAIIFLASALGLASIAADPHRRFYPRYFTEKKRFNGLPFLLYVSSLGILLGLGCTLVFAMCRGLTGSALIAGAGVLYFVSEKLADEVLRFRLFEENFEAWGWATMGRVVLQLVGLAFLVLVMRHNPPVWMQAVTLALGNLIIFVPHVPRLLWRFLNPGKLTSVIWLIKRAFRIVVSDRILWVLALLSGGLGYLDRCIAVFVDRKMFPIFMLAAMCLSVVQLMVDFFYVSRNRRAFLEQRISARSLIGSYEFLGILTSGLIAGLAACFVMLHFTRNGEIFPLRYVLVIAILQISLALISVVREIPYWLGYLRLMVGIDISFYIMFAFVVFVSWSLQLSVGWFFAMAIACVLVRLLTYIACSLQFQQKAVQVVETA